MVQRVSEVVRGAPGARSVRRPTVRHSHMDARHLAARIVAYAATTSRDQDEFSKALQVVTAEDTTYSGKSLHVVMYL
jgi:hypothetical protein